MAIQKQLMRGTGLAALLLTSSLTAALAQEAETATEAIALEEATQRLVIDLETPPAFLSTTLIDNGDVLLNINKSIEGLEGLDRHKRSDNSVSVEIGMNNFLTPDLAFPDANEDYTLKTWGSTYLSLIHI